MKKQTQNSLAVPTTTIPTSKSNNNQKQVNHNNDLERKIKENISVGMVIKNYKELCNLLNIPILSGGNMKQSQIKQLKCYMDFDKSGKKFIITDIFDAPLTVNDQRKLGNNSIYSHYVEILLLQQLHKSSGKILASPIELFKMLCFANNNYKNISYDDLIMKNPSLTYSMISKFYLCTYNKFHRILKSTLKNMFSRNIISVTHEIIIFISDNNYFMANKEQKEIILSIEQQLLHHQYNDSTIHDLFVSGKYRKFYESVNEILKNKYGWMYCQKQYLIIYTGHDEIIPLSENEIYYYQKELNSRILDFVKEYSGNSYYVSSFDYKTCKNYEYGKNFLADYLLKV